MAVLDPDPERPCRAVAAHLSATGPGLADELRGCEVAQCDFWFPDIAVPVGFGQTRTATVLTMVTGYARWASAVLIPTRRTEDLFTGWWQLINTLGAAPRVLGWDGEGAVGRWRGKRSELTADCQGFVGPRLRRS